MFVNEVVLERGRQKDALFVFVHCQRTGGSNLQRWFRRVFPDSAIYSVRTTGEGYTPWHAMTDMRALDSMRMISGFTYFIPRDIGRPIVALANVRHPFYRNVSLYRMSRKANNHFMHDFAKAATFPEFYRRGSAIKPYYFNNLQCKRIGNATSAEAAITAMHTHFGMVGTTNSLSEGTLKLIQTYSWDVDPIKVPSSPPDEVNYAEDVESSIYDEIMENNAEDARLYEYVVRQGRGV